MTKWARPIVELEFIPVGAGEAHFHVFLNHWTSPLEGMAETEEKRLAAAQTLLARIQGMVVADAVREFYGDPDAMVLAVGDFNAEPYAKY